ncbi:MAG: glutamyl-tRNA reductase [Bacillota bacterium]|nr:glutamyl-tRNA reductase [Bacillota bacterium]
MDMNISVLGIDHRYGADVREKVAFSESQKLEFSTKLIDIGVEEIVILSTCNRSEVYFLDQWKNDAVRNQVLDAYIDYFDIKEYSDCIFRLHDNEAVEHIFKVTAGLESAIVGEDEILRQIKETYEFSRQFKNTGKYFNHLFQEAIKCAKKIKSTLKISEIPISTGYIGLKYLEEQAGSFEDKNLLLIGFGEIGKLFYQYGRELPFKNIFICNRSYETVKAVISQDEKTKYIPYGQCHAIMDSIDIAVTATSCPHYILKAEEMEPRTKPLYLLDMAIPRNIDTAINDMDNYFLYNLDVLKDMSARNKESRDALRVQAQTLINEATEEYIEWVKKSAQDPIIESLNQSVDDILSDHLNYLFKKIKVNEREKVIISRTMQSALKKAVRNPIVALKSIEDKEKRAHYSEVLGELFQLNEGGKA